MRKLCNIAEWLHIRLVLMCGHIFDHPADESHLFSKAEMENKIDLHHLRALRAQKMYKYYLERII